jgi:putative addiction module killer protein
MSSDSNWRISYFSDSLNNGQVEQWLDSISVAQLKSVAKELYLLSACGNGLRLPHSKSIGKGIFELRERSNGFRMYYTFVDCKEIVILHAGDKDSQEKDIKIARKKLNSLIKTRV